MSIRWQLLAGFILLMAACAIQGYLALSSTSMLGMQIRQLYDGPMMAINSAQLAGAEFHRAETAAGEALRASDRPAAAPAMRRLESHYEVFQEALSIVRERTADASVRAKIEQILQRAGLWRDAIAARLASDAPAGAAPTTPPAEDVSIALRDEIERGLAELVETEGVNSFGFLEQADEAIRRAYWTGVAAAVFCLVLGVVGVWRLSRRILSAIGQALTAANRIADGDLNTPVATARRDEGGDLLRAVGRMQEALQRIEAERVKDQERSEAARRAQMSEAAALLSDAVGRVVDSVARTAGEQRAAASIMTEMAGRTSERTASASSAADQARVTTQTVAQAAEQMRTAIADVAGHVAKSSDVARQASSDAATTRSGIDRLVDAVERIASVAELINSIAAKTNLLALNATIEAARAGEAGRGFAVVAGEVKALAAQTANATGEIREQVAEIQAATSGARESVIAIAEIVERMNAISGSVANAVAEQDAATGEIARHIQAVANDSTRISNAVRDVARDSAETRAAASTVLTNADALVAGTETLRQEVDTFLSKVRSAA